jgi:hypothetical protein
VISNNITLILYVTGLVTASMILQFISPRLMVEKILKLKVEGDTAEIFERHWGVLVFVTGVLIMYAGFDPAVRTPILAGALVEKAVLVLLVLANYRKGYLRNFTLMSAIAFDALCVVIYLLYLLGLS